MENPTCTDETGSFLVSTSQVNAEGVHVWPFDTRCPVDVVRHRLSGQHPFRMNRHDYFEFVYLQSGSVVWQIQDSLLAEEEGDLFMMTNPKYHRVTEHSSSNVYAESLFFNPDLVRSNWGDDFHILGEFFARETALQHVIASESGLPDEILGLIRRISRELPARDDRALLTVKTYLKMILVLLMTHSGVPERCATAGPDRRRAALDNFKPLFSLLEDRYREAITPNEAAQVMHMSPSNFRRTFKQVTGQSFVSYLNHFRVAKAQELLTTSDMPIADIGLDTGFCDQSYFGMIFRRLTQTTPRQYRQHSRRMVVYADVHDHGSEKPRYSSLTQTTSLHYSRYA